MHLEDLKTISSTQFAALGAGHVGYIRAVETENGPSYELRAADGQQLATADTWDAVLFAADHLEIEPVTLQ